MPGSWRKNRSRPGANVRPAGVRHSDRAIDQIEVGDGSVLFEHLRVDNRGKHDDNAFGRPSPQHDLHRHDSAAGGGHTSPATRDTTHC
jgi:hypothetical protein